MISSLNLFSFPTFTEDLQIERRTLTNAIRSSPKPHQSAGMLVFLFLVLNLSLAHVIHYVPPSLSNVLIVHFTSRSILRRDDTGCERLDYVLRIWHSDVVLGIKGLQ
jgi:hypothetical protein